MRGIERKSGSCGECQYFDSNKVNGKPFGTIQESSSGEPIKEGVCRTNKGLALPIRNEKTNCVQPPGIFLPVKELVKSNN